MENGKVIAVGNFRRSIIHFNYYPLSTIKRRARDLNPYNASVSDLADRPGKPYPAALQENRRHAVFNGGRIRDRPMGTGSTLLTLNIQLQILILNYLSGLLGNRTPILCVQNRCLPVRRAARFLCWMK